jgi:hypothetical protein
MTGGKLLGLLLLALIAGILSLIVGTARLLFRLADRGGRRAWKAIADSRRSLFGPTGPPKELCRRLRAKHPSLSPGVGNGLSFSCSGCPGRLDFIAGMTEIRFELDERAGARLEVSTPSFVTQLAEDDPNAFRVRGSEDLYREIFRDEELSAWLRNLEAPFEWTFGPSGFFLQIRDLPRNEEELWRWLKLSFRLLAAVPGFEHEPSVEVTAITRAALAESQCQVCGGSLGQGTVVYCRRCATPHHEDCWIYATECSTFACRERRFLRASAPAPEAASAASVDGPAGAVPAALAGLRIRRTAAFFMTVARMVLILAAALHVTVGARARGDQDGGQEGQEQARDPLRHREDCTT